MEKVFYYYDSSVGFIYEYNISVYYNALDLARSSFLRFLIYGFIFVFFYYLFFLVFYLIKRVLL